MKQDQTDWLFERLGLAVLEEDERVGVTANAVAQSLLGRETWPTLGSALRRLLGEDVKRTEIEECLARTRSGSPCELEAPNGHQVLLSQAAPGRARAIISLRLQTIRAELAPRSDIDAGVSHELANALGAIAGWARLAKQGRRVQEALDLIEMSAESAWSAAQRVLSGLRNKRDREPDSVDLSAFVDEAARLLAPKAAAKAVHVRTAIEPGLRVQGDRGSAWSIVWNLAANAVEALAEDGTVELRLNQGDGTAVLIVEDNGPGMTTEQKRRAFEPYFTTKPTGTGLGLPLVKQAVADVGGSIDLESEPQVGTCFTVRLPLAAGLNAQRQANLKRSSGVFYAEPIHQRVLVVDDDLGLREMIGTALGMRGADVVTVGSAEAALAQSGQFTVAIIDLLLPQARGDSLLARLRESHGVEVGMLMTGTELPSSLASGGEPDVLLRKPFELEELFEGLATGIARGRDAKSVGRVG